MAKRRLSKQQSRRIRQKQHAHIARASSEIQELDENTLGAERHGQVIAHFGQQVQVEGDGERLRCYLRANIESVVTGDQVIWREADTVGVVESVLPRRSVLSRPDSYGNLKAIAANIDQIIITIASEPEFHHNLIDRYLVAAELQEITPVILINKMDLIRGDLANKIAATEESYAQLGYHVIKVSAKKQQALDELKAILKNKTSIFVGQSGVGKSSLIKQLIPTEDILIGDMSEGAGKGKHTTTHSQLFHFQDGGDCIDSPGIREFGLWHLQTEHVIFGFKELREFANRCKFRNCAHLNEPGCAIKLALEKNKISEARLNSYHRILATLNDVTIKL